jgi:nitroimidazol reductase NimA-like FMN-containing flavoprotein (pyridoxamine 5'-phosphate oxidase superfamily)
VPAPEQPEASLVVSLKPLSREECLALMTTTSLGRVAFLVDGRPEVLPVNYVVDGDNVVFRTGEDTVLNQVAMQVVAFEVDQIDERSHTGWSVVAQGVAHDVTDAIDPTSERLRALSLVSWAPGQRHRWLRVDANRITGRRLDVAPQPS